MKKFIIALTAFCAAAATGCVRDIDETMTPAGKTAINISFELPVADTLMVASRSEADNSSRENEIKRLDIFSFDENGDIVAGSEGHTVMTNVTVAGAVGRAVVYVTIPSDQTEVKRQFYMVANCDPALVAGVSTMSQLRDLVQAGITEMPDKEFLMSGYTMLNTISGTNSPTVNMSLRRVVARVDILLADGVDNFQITYGRIINSRDRAYLFEKLDNDYNVVPPTGAGYVTYDAVTGTEESHKKSFTGMLYCQENYNADKDDDAKTTGVIVGGVYKGETYYYRVNLNDNASNAQVRRNYVYKVNILAVNGPGNTDADAAINDAPQNIEYEIIEWDYSLHCDVIFDGRHYLGLSRSAFTFGKEASEGTAQIVTNLDNGDLQVSTTDANGNPANYSWLSFSATDTKITINADANDAANALPRVAYLKVESSTKSRLKLIIKVQQYHTGMMLLSFSPAIISVPAIASDDRSTTGTIHLTGAQWSIQSVYLIEDETRDWCRITSPYTFGDWYDETPFTLNFEVDAMNTSIITRTAIVNVKVKDPVSGLEEMRTVSISQTNNTDELSLSRYYIGKMSAPDVEKVSIMTENAWHARFWSGDRYTAPEEGCSWIHFADENYNVLPDTEMSGSGNGTIYLVFDAVSENKNGFIVITDGGGKEHLIRTKRFAYPIEKINGYEMIELPDVYQWGRMNDGYEMTGAVHNATTATGKVYKQPRSGDAAYGRAILPGASTATANPADLKWLTVDPSSTPLDQRDINKLWDLSAIASNDIKETNITGRKSDFDPCPDGWRVPTAREMENIFVYGPKRLLTPDKTSAAPLTRQIMDDNGRLITLTLAVSSSDYFRRVYWPTSGSAMGSTNIINSNATIRCFWTSSHSADYGPYALMILGNDTPLVTYKTTFTKNNTRWPLNIFDFADSFMMGVRCIRDNQVTEELSVDKRRTTLNYEQQELSVELTANNINGLWTATSSDPSWLSVVSGSSGVSGQTIRLRVTENGGDNREGYVRVETSSGTVANIGVRQLSYMGVKINGLWFMDRNLGATRADHNKEPHVNDDTTLGSIYPAGTPYAYSQTVLYKGLGNSNYGKSQWNDNSKMRVYGTSGFILGPEAAIPFPYPVKNEIYDPCPPGWRIPTYYEANRLLLAIRDRSELYTVGNRYYNKLVIDDNGREVCFPAITTISADVFSGGSGGYYHTSTFAYAPAGTYPAYHASYMFTWVTTGNPAFAAGSGQTSNGYHYSRHPKVAARCVQDIPDDWDEYADLLLE